MGRNTIYVMLALVAVLSFIAIGITNAKSIEPRITGQAIATINGNVQEVALTFKNYEYQLTPGELTVGVPVRMEVDLDSVYGCMRDVVIAQFGVRKYVSEGDNIIEFTPDKTGTFTIACSMNMGRGTFEVVEADGTSSGYVEETSLSTAGGSCGSSPGSCGCAG